MRNDLMKLVASLDCVDLVLSHTDGDHWRLLAWDESLREKINNIYVPEKAKSLTLKDKAVCKKVKEVNSFGYELSGGGSLEVLRSIPATKDDNTECLVSLYKSSDMRHLALQSGDYVYKDMIQDGNPSIRSLDQHRYSAIVVPHHGDAASAKAIFKPLCAGRSIAFFAAGDHGYYRHPTSESLTAHQQAQFQTVSYKTTAHIEAVQLIP